MTDWRSIASDLVDGVASPVDRQAFEQWLEERPEHADECVLWLEIHDQIRANLQADQIRHTARPLPSRSKTQGGLGSWLAERPLTTLSVWSCGLAAALMAALWIGGFRPASEQGLAQAPSEARVAEDLDNAQIAATLTGAVDCRWEQGTTTYAYGEHLPAGAVLKLAEGLAQLTYECGAKVVLRGPSEFHVDGPTDATLPVGQITAVVPRRAAGFAVMTPCAEVIDLGTEFAIDVDPSGASQVHVFKGEVVSRRRVADGDDESQALHLVTNEAAEYRPDRETAREFRAQEDRFIREITPRLTASELPQAPQCPDLALWLAADLLVKTDEEDRVVAWRDVLCGDNQSPDDALQANAWARPRFKQGVLNGADAVRFDGISSHLVTTPMQTTSDQTVVLVAQCRLGEDPAADSKIYPGSLLNYNGPPHRNLVGRYLDSEPGVLQLGLGREGNSRLGIQAFVYVGSSARSGQINSEPIEPNKPFVASYIYNMTENRAAMHLNGRLQAEASAPAPAGVTSRRVLGKHGHLAHFFNGDVGEVLIFNRALTPNEMRRITDYLGRKYDLPTGGV